MTPSSERPADASLPRRGGRDGLPGEFQPLTAATPAARRTAPRTPKRPALPQEMATFPIPPPLKRPTPPPPARPELLSDAPRTTRHRLKGTGSAAAVGGGLVLLVVGVVAAVVMRPAPDDGNSRTAAALVEPDTRDVSAPLLVPEDGEYVETAPLDSGDLLVTHWIHTDRPMNLVTVTVPTSPGLTDQPIEVSRFVVAADGAQVEAPDTLDPRLGWTGSLMAAHDVYVQYQVSGVLQRSDSAEGRTLALLTSLDVGVGRRILSKTQTFHGGEVLSLACLPPGEQSMPRPCGTLDDGTWTVSSEPGSVDDTVIAQFDLSEL